MGRIVITEYMSLDGVVEAPGPGDVEDYPHKGWVFATERGEDGDTFKLDETLRSEALLLGRITYETFAATWPPMSGPFADKLNELPKYVVSQTLTEPTWANTTVLGGIDQVAELRRELDGDIVVHGSARLAQALIERDLVDELRLMVYPLLLGAGNRLFADAGRKPLRLVETRTVGDGIVILIHAPSR